MPGPDIDLQDPEQLAALLNSTLFDEEVSAEEIAGQVETLIASDNPAFANIGRAPTGTPEDLDADDDLESTDGQDDAMAGVGPDDPTAGMGPDEGDGQDDLMMRESASSPVRPGHKLWTDMDRRRSRGTYTIYRLEAKHTRREPIESAFTGHCQAVRVSLPETPVDRDSYIGTFLGKVEATDHKLFSVQEVRDFYQEACGQAITIERVDLITGARFLGRRFSPVSIYLGFARADQPNVPCFYILEGGSASGQPKALYVARDMTTVIHQKSGFSFTPLACANNWYRGGLEMNSALDHPERVYLTAAQERDGSFDYLDLSVRYAVSKGTKRVVAPFELQVEAAMRVLAISEQIGCNLKLGQGGGMQPVLGPIAEALIPWDIKPRGSASKAERLRYCGCPDPASTAVDPTPPPKPSGPDSSKPDRKPPDPLPPERKPTEPPDRARPTSSTRPAEADPPARKPKPAV